MSLRVATFVVTAIGEGDDDNGRTNPDPSIGAARSCAAGAASDTCQSRPVVANYRWT
jgi:hypothetical protein